MTTWSPKDINATSEAFDSACHTVQILPSYVPECYVLHDSLAEISKNMENLLLFSEKMRRLERISVRHKKERRQF